MMLATWLVEFYLSKCNELDDIVASESESSDVENLQAERTILEEDLRNFFETYKVCCCSFLTCPSLTSMITRAIWIEQPPTNSSKGMVGQICSCIMLVLLVTMSELSSIGS